MPPASDPASEPTGPPRPERRPSSRSHHEQVTDDPYAWLLDADDPATVAHLRAENAWTDHALAPLEPLRRAIFEEIRERTQENDFSVPVRDGDWWYHHRTEEGQSYPIFCRAADDGTGSGPLAGRDQEQVMLDLNVVAAAESAGTGPNPYLGLGVLDVSPDGHWLAYALDREGDERHQLRFRDLRTGDESVEAVEEVSDGFAWAADSATCWYTVPDDASRPHRILRHTVGTDPRHDVEVFREDDERFHLGVSASRSGRVVVVTAASAVTSESWLLDAEVPGASAQLVAARQQGVEYSVTHHRSGLLVTSNHGGAEDFALWRAPLEGMVVARREQWQAVIGHRCGTRLLGTEAFAEQVIVHGRTEGSTALWVLEPGSDTLRRLRVDEAATIGPGDNRAFDTSTYQFRYTSLNTPPTVVDVDLSTGVRTVRKQLPVLGGFEPADYRSERQWAVTETGTRVPLSLVWRPDRTDPTEPAPLVLYGYGAYELSMDPWFSISRLSLLDRGVVFAIAHVRGGGELGRGWYEDGKLGAKTNSFDDLVACARHLVETGRTAPDRLAIRGGSAGGLLVGAAANRAPELFRAVVAEVPFVDPLTTMLDPSLPLTVIEWEEWGNPLQDPDAHRWLAGYSPYENVPPPGPFPAVLATGGLNDPRVGFHEPAKWVAALRDHGHGTSAEDRPVLLRTELEAGHGGPTGRYDAWREEAEVLAFLLNAITPGFERSECEQLAGSPSAANE